MIIYDRAHNNTISENDLYLFCQVRLLVQRYLDAFDSVRSKQNPSLQGDDLNRFLSSIGVVKNQN